MNSMNVMSYHFGERADRIYAKTSCFSCDKTDCLCRDDGDI